MLNMPQDKIVRRPARCTHSCKPNRRNDISANPMILVYFLRIFNSAIQPGHKILSEAYESLEENGYIEKKPEDGMRRLEVLVAWPSLVDLNYYEAGQQGRNTDEVEEEVRDRAVAFLRGCVGRLQDEGRLGYEEEAGGVKQLERSALAGV